METVTVSEAKASLSRLLQRVLDGETIAIGRRGKPEVLLTPLTHDPTPRVLGGWAADEEYWMADDFDAPLPDIEDAIERSTIGPAPVEPDQS